MLGSTLDVLDVLLKKLAHILGAMCVFVFVHCAHIIVIAIIMVFKNYFLANLISVLL